MLEIIDATSLFGRDVGGSIRSVVVEFSPSDGAILCHDHVPHKILAGRIVVDSACEEI
jgi:hypothetical protein